MFVDQLLEFELTTTAAGHGTGDAGDAFRVGYAFRQQLLDLSAGSTAAVTKDFVNFGCIIRKGGCHGNWLGAGLRCCCVFSLKVN